MVAAPFSALRTRLSEHLSNIKLSSEKHFLNTKYINLHNHGFDCQTFQMASKTHLFREEVFYEPEHNDLKNSV